LQWLGQKRCTETFSIRSPSEFLSLVADSSKARLATARHGPLLLAVVIRP
jgi:hypothetical protein